MSRIWDIHPSKLCKNHLLGEHRELHGVWTVITQNKKGYANHPETMRWRGKLPALKRRHDMLVAEFKRRGWKSGFDHKTPLSLKGITGSKIQRVKVDPLEQQIKEIKAKGCNCKL